MSKQTITCSGNQGCSWGAKSSFAQGPRSKIFWFYLKGPNLKNIMLCINGKCSTSSSPDTIIHAIPYYLAQSLPPKIQPSISLNLVLSSIIKSIHQLVLILPSLYEKLWSFSITKGKKMAQFPLWNSAS